MTTITERDGRSRRTVASVLRAMTPLGVIGFLLAAVPRAGFRVLDFPVPIMLVVLGATVAVLLVWRRESLEPLDRKTIVLLVLLGVWLDLRLARLTAQGVGVDELLELTAWTILPALLVIPVAKGMRVPSWGRAIELGVMAACIFAVVQAVFGIEETAVNGLTIAWGDDYADKFIGIFDTSTEFQKIPSTYHNGNIFGVITGFFLIVALRRLIDEGPLRWNGALLALCGVATILSGSRTVVIAVAAAALVTLLVPAGSPRANRRRVVALTCIVSVVVLALLLEPGLRERLAWSSLTERGGAGRTQAWSRAIELAGPAGLIFGEHRWARGIPRFNEGIVLAACQFGIVGIGLLVAVIGSALARPHLRVWVLPFIVVGVAALIDSAYMLFPTLFIPLARMLAPFGPDASPPTGPDELVVERT